MFTRFKHTAPRAILLAAILSTAALAIALPMSDQTSTLSDPVGDTLCNAPAFQDVVFGRMTKTASGDFELLMEMAGPVPVNPPMPPPARSEIWWAWGFNLDPTTFPRGWPNPEVLRVGLPGEFVVIVSWDGTEFAGTAVDRRPLLTGGEAIITPVPFSINGTIVDAVLASTLIGAVPPSFHWSPTTFDWSGPVGSEGVSIIDGAEAVFNP